MNITTKEEKQRISLFSNSERNVTNNNKQDLDDLQKIENLENSAEQRREDEVKNTRLANENLKQNSSPNLSMNNNFNQKFQQSQVQHHPPEIQSQQQNLSNQDLQTHQVVG